MTKIFNINNYFLFNKVNNIAVLTGMLFFAACSTKNNTYIVDDTNWGEHTGTGYFVLNKTSSNNNKDFILRNGGNILYYNQPSGVHYTGKHSRTYFAWLDHRNVVQLAYYDDHYNRVTHYSDLFAWPYKDDHAQPVLHIKNKGHYKGHVFVFSSLHNSRLVFTRSEKPESITDFTPLSIIDSGKCTYPSIIENDEGDLMLFYTRNIYSKNTVHNHWTRSLYYRTSGNGGDGWSDEIELVTGGEGTWIYYVQPVLNSDNIHIAFSIMKNDGGVYDVHYVQSTDWGKTWVYNHSSVSKLPIIATQPLYESPQGTETRAWDMKLNENASPVIAYQNYDSNHGRSYVMYNIETTPKSYFVSNSINSYYPAGIVIDEQNTSVVYAGTAMKNGRNAIVEKTWGEDIDSFVTSKIVSKDTGRHQMRPQTVKNYNNLKLLWVDEVEYNSFQDYKTNLKAYITNTR